MSRADPHICIIGASFDNHNLGVGALTTGAVQCILHSWPQATVSLLNYAQSGYTHTVHLADRDVSIPLVNIRFSKRLYLHNNIVVLLCLATLVKLLPHRGLRARVLASNPSLRYLQQIDIVASVAGGDSFSDIYGLGRLLYVCLPQLLALLLNKRLILLPQTVGPFKGKLAKAIGRYIINRAEAVFSREQHGLSVVRALLRKDRQERSHFCYDIGFVVEPVRPTRFRVVGLNTDKEEGRCLIGVNVSGLLLTGTYSKINAFGLTTRYDTLICTIIEFLITEKTASILLVPHVMGWRGESDVLACQTIYNDLQDKYPGRIGIVEGEYNASEIKYVIGLCDVFVGSRMHACIAAISQHVPAVSLAYSDKFVGVMATVGVDGLVADLRTMDGAEILRVVDGALEQRAVIRRRLEQDMPIAKKRALNLLNETIWQKADLGVEVKGCGVTGAENK